MVSQATSSLESQFDGIEEVPNSVDEAAVRRMSFVANLLDDSIRVPGTEFRIGIDPILGIVPAAGDAVSAALSVYIVLESARLGVPFLTLLRMIANVALDFAVGSVPVVGTMFDAVWKANQKNVELAVDSLDGESIDVTVE
ncbi:DUF4112 domain-containing protein [Halobacteriales archaeon SW_5_68_122]|nr:MAG: DUF4112 domain-containing protein [Halobacteriales archaeon SW_5_68_122]